MELHLHDNLAFDTNGRAVEITGRYTAGSARILPAAMRYLPPRLRLLPASQLEDQVLLAAGARPRDRDAIDFKLLSDVAEGRARIVDSEVQSSGYPLYAPTMRPFDAADWNLADMSPKAGWLSLFTAPPR